MVTLWFLNIDVLSLHCETSVPHFVGVLTHQPDICGLSALYGHEYN